MNVQLIAAGILAVIAAAIHGGAGEVLVVRRLSPETLAGTAFGGPRMTGAMIHVTWHVTTIAFLAAGIALLLSGSVLEGDAARAVGLVAAGMSTGFAAVAVGLGAADTRTPRSLLRHPGPVALAVVAALAWWGALLWPQ
jgi:hypothetical protein